MERRLTKDEKLLETETPQDQVDRMGNGWSLEAQYEKQLQLPVHLQKPGPPITPAEDPTRQGALSYTTLCGLIIGDVMLRSTDDEEDATCLMCKERYEASDA
jgi:hypothetical protein